MGRTDDHDRVTAIDLEKARRAFVAARGTAREDEMRAAFVALIGQANHEFWEERAAIRQYDGGMTREDAEREALRDVRGES